MITLTSHLYLVKAETERLDLACGDGCRQALEAFFRDDISLPRFSYFFQSRANTDEGPVTHHFEL